MSIFLYGLLLVISLIGVTNIYNTITANVHLRKKELEEQLVELEKRMKQNAALREKAKVQEEFEEEKTKLDRALAMDVITQDEYNFKLSIAKKKVDNFDEIRRIEQQFDMGIITKEEKNSKIDALMQ